MLFSTPKLTAFLASVVAVSAQSGVFFSLSNCVGTQLQTVEYTDGQYTDLAAYQDPSFQVILSPGESDCVNIPSNIQSVGMRR
ncbi:hypothetical protein C8J57DRAFT_1344837 [Mycena rebaudengoi]|nr:hypothetical protein C8J57DRAFT_1344837 [Mycena rebaudengoi]